MVVELLLHLRLVQAVHEDEHPDPVVVYLLLIRKECELLPQIVLFLNGEGYYLLYPSVPAELEYDVPELHVVYQLVLLVLVKQLL